MVQTCSETVDILWKAAFLGIVGFAAYNWMVKEGVTQGNWAARGAKYLKGRAFR